jgi:hypothetical protein
MTTSDFKGEGLAALRATLHRLNLAGRADSILMTASRYLEDRGRELLPTSGGTGLSTSEHNALMSVGVNPDQEVSGRAVLDTAAHFAVILETALPIVVAARKLGVNPARLKERIRERTLIAVDVSAREWLLPNFQFTTSGELRGLRSVVRTIRPGASIIAVVSFFTSPQADLENDEGESMTPVAWLASGRDPNAVRSLAAAI